MGLRRQHFSAFYMEKVPARASMILSFATNERDIVPSDSSLPCETRSRTKWALFSSPKVLGCYLPNFPLFTTLIV
jgi:hypothetical protein